MRPTSPKFASNPVARLGCALFSLTGGTRTVTLHALPREALLLLAFSKDRPFVALESSSPLPGWIAPSLRRSAATPPARSNLVVSHHYAGLLLDHPVRTFAAAHDPGVHRRFTRVPKFSRFPRCVSALRSFPSADSCGALDTAEASCNARCPCGEALASCPTVTLLCCTSCDVP